jgi:rhodanese-related sulfurtransferase
VKNILTEELRKRLDGGDAPALVEVLGADEFREYHLPGAINVPLSSSFQEDIQKAVPDKRRPVVIYCRDPDCHASPTAAHVMSAHLGYSEVYEYAEGKEGWKAAGLPVEKG